MEQEEQEENRLPENPQKMNLPHKDIMTSQETEPLEEMAGDIITEDPLEETHQMKIHQEEEEVEEEDHQEKDETSDPLNPPKVKDLSNCHHGISTLS